MFSIGGNVWLRHMAMPQRGFDKDKPNKPRCVHSYKGVYNLCFYSIDKWLSSPSWQFCHAFINAPRENKKTRNFPWHLFSHKFQSRSRVLAASKYPWGRRCSSVLISEWPPDYSRHNNLRGTCTVYPASAFRKENGCFYWSLFVLCHSHFYTYLITWLVKSFQTHWSCNTHKHRTLLDS